MVKILGLRNKCLEFELIARTHHRQRDIGMRQRGKIRFNGECERLCQQEMTCIEFSMFSEISDMTK
ncbi:hypothetical protein LFZ31_27915 [Salmonella enterica subsp. enterica serovar Newport str. S09097]|nr:hypothetical protein LFZ31_27915 [Salmonella enterica subsp. enterica serovar Newport str. S09097]